MPPGWHITTKESGGVLSIADRSLAGRFAIEVELFLFPNPSEHPFGIALQQRDGDQVRGEVQFLFRRDGMAMARAEHGRRDTVLVAWKGDTAVKAHVPAEVVKYVLRVQNDAGHLAFSINGRELLAVPTDVGDHPLVPALRIGAGLNLHISRVDLVTPLAPPRPRRESRSEMRDESGEEGET
jgi:hypothetical protein